MNLIILDFDGTIHLEETPKLFLRILKRNRKLRIRVTMFYISISWVYVLYKFGLCHQLMVKKVLMGLSRLMSGMDYKEFDLFFATCMSEAKNNFSPECLKRIKIHLDNNDHLLILSSAFTGFISLVAEELGIKHWFGTELEIKDGYSTGRITTLLDGDEKVTMLKTFLQDIEKEGMSFDLSEAYAYADGTRDLPLLNLVGHPIAVNPDPGLRKIAFQRKWEIIDDI